MFTYKPLWKILIDRNMTKEDLRKALGFSHATIAKMSKGKYVALQVLDKICSYLKVQLGDVIEHVPDEAQNNR